MPEAGRAFYHPELDALRFFAFFLVFLGHSDYNVFDPRWAPIQFVANLCYAVHGAGFSGVALFFCLSAYLITELLLREQSKTGTIHVRAFYIRRILRVWPLYFFFLLALRPLVHRWLPWEQFGLRYTLSFLLLVGNWQCVLGGWPASVAAPLWSISIEEQFYLGWPLFVLRWRRHLPVFAIAMLAVANLTRVSLIVSPHLDTGLWCNTLARLDPFALGALLAYGLHGREIRMSGPLRGSLAGLALLLLLMVGKYGDHTSDRAILSYPTESLACALLLFAVLLPRGAWQPGRAGRALLYLGRISYGLYVYHLLVIKLFLEHTSFGFWVRQPMALGVTVILAAISYAVMEEPFLRLKRRFTYVRSRV